MEIHVCKVKNSHPLRRFLAVAVTGKVPACTVPRAVLFDAYGTLFDVHSVASLAEQAFPRQGSALSQAWRDKQIEYTRLVSMSANTQGEPAAHYQTFWDLTRAALRHAAPAWRCRSPRPSKNR